VTPHERDADRQGVNWRTHVQLLREYRNLARNMSETGSPDSVQVEHLNRVVKQIRDIEEQKGRLAQELAHFKQSFWALHEKLSRYGYFIPEKRLRQLADDPAFPRQAVPEDAQASLVREQQVLVEEILERLLQGAEHSKEVLEGLLVGGGFSREALREILSDEELYASMDVGAAVASLVEDFREVRQLILGRKGQELPKFDVPAKDWLEKGLRHLLTTRHDE